MSVTELILQAKTWGKSNQEVASILKPPCSIACLRSIYRDINQIPFPRASSRCQQSLEIVSGFYFEKWVRKITLRLVFALILLAEQSLGSHCLSLSYWKRHSQLIYYRLYILIMFTYPTLLIAYVYTVLDTIYCILPMPFCTITHSYIFMYIFFIPLHL